MTVFEPATCDFGALFYFTHYPLGVEQTKCRKANSVKLGRSEVRSAVSEEQSKNGQS